MTPRQQQLLAFIRDFIAEHEFSPGYVEMAQHLGLRSKSGVNRMIHALADSGFITFDAFRKRSIRIIEDGSDYARGYRDGFAAAQVKQATSVCA